LAARRAAGSLLQHLRRHIERIKAPCVAATLDSSGVEIVVFFRS